MKRSKRVDDLSSLEKGKRERDIKESSEDCRGGCLNTTAVLSVTNANEKEESSCNELLSGFKRNCSSSERFLMLYSDLVSTIQEMDVFDQPSPCKKGPAISSPMKFSSIDSLIPKFDNIVKLPLDSAKKMLHDDIKEDDISFAPKTCVLRYVPPISDLA